MLNIKWISVCMHSSAILINITDDCKITFSLARSFYIRITVLKIKIKYFSTRVEFIETNVLN